jgi:hypothetical protein
MAPASTASPSWPSAGEGDFVVPAARRALARLRPGEIDRAAGLLKAVEVNTASLEICRARLQEVFGEFGWGTAATGEVLDQWLVQADFLTTPLAGYFTHIVGNPPYIRLEALPKELLKLYRSRWRSLYDRADLYVAFIERSLGLLAPQGRLGFISEFLIRQENGLAHFRQIDTPHSPTTRRSFRPMGAAHTSPRQRLGNTPCDTRAF